ncbi:MAG: hypothetical protein H0U27_00930 [Nitrosopumilus sp.]|nr:hypothetical protein [Nitrosopumilus sp.]
MKQQSLLKSLVMMTALMINNLHTETWASNPTAEDQFKINESFFISPVNDEGFIEINFNPNQRINNIEGFCYPQVRANTQEYETQKSLTEIYKKEADLFTKIKKGIEYFAFYVNSTNLWFGSTAIEAVQDKDQLEPNQLNRGYQPGYISEVSSSEISSESDEEESIHEVKKGDLIQIIKNMEKSLLDSEYEDFESDNEF